MTLNKPSQFRFFMC